MASLTYHFVRRGLEMSSQHFTAGQGNDGGETEPRKISAWAALVVLATALIMGLSLSLIIYVYGMVVATLAAVEDPKPDLYIAVDGNDNGDDNVNKTIAPEGPARPRPITSKLRTTINHLRSRAGRWAPFRGLGLFILWSFVRSILLSRFGVGGPLGHLLMRSLAAVAADVALAPVQMAWVHIVISEPSPKSMFKRIPGLRSWAKFAPAAVLSSAASHFGRILPLYLGQVLQVVPREPFATPTVRPSDPSIIWKAPIVIVVSLAITFLIEIPATVTMVRVAASMLPEEDETIVPFDRSFGGKVTPAVVGGSGKVGLLDAWKTFTWPSRIRLMKVVAKVACMVGAISLACGAIFVVEFTFILKGCFDKPDGGVTLSFIN